METLTALAPYAAAIPLVYMVNEGLKQAGMSSRWAGLVNIALGLVFGVAMAHYLGRDLLEGVLGLLFALSTGGAYSGAKATLESEAARAARKEAEAAAVESTKSYM